MISVIVPTRDSAVSLPVCLTALVSAAVSGLVREVILADSGSGDATLAIAADAGAKVVTGDVAAAVATARGDWVLILPPGTRLETGWEAEAAEHIDRHAGKAACFRQAYDSAALSARFREGLATLGAPKPEQGWLVETKRFGQGGLPVRKLGARAFT